ncbi:hypothetical protein RRG08_065124 [Elysia crispata]|uniref:Uncharacterized protein n=1 Tax=Elysia crispata TaxID=231223 RepID=A0AAE0Z9K1_9GAST|nr:hypothetical protein RRG08_065124 [Elysia crispata]
MGLVCQDVLEITVSPNQDLIVETRDKLFTVLFNEADGLGSSVTTGIRQGDHHFISKALFFPGNRASHKNFSYPSHSSASARLFVERLVDRLIPIRLSVVTRPSGHRCR